MKKQIKKFSAFLLSVAMLCSSLSIGGTVSAEDTTQSSYKHSDSYKVIYDYFYKNGKFPTDYADSDSYFTYLYGINGSYQEMKKCHAYFGWTNNYALGWSADEATYPGVNSWFMATTPDKHSVMDFHAQQSGEINIVASGVYAGAAGVQMLIVQKRGEKYCPIYPQKDSWEWKNVPLKSDAFDLNITTAVEKGDEILIIAGGTATHILCIDPVFTFTGNSGTAIDTSSFSAFGGIEIGVTYSHSTLFKKSDKSTPKSFDIDGSYFQYLVGIDGEFSELSEYSTTSWVGAGGVWTVGKDNYPWVAQWNIAMRDSIDGVISWHSAKEGSVVISSAEEINSSMDNAELLIVQKRGNVYYPLYPTAGSFEWKTVTPDAFTLPEVTADVKAGDEILFIARADVSGIVNINPQIVFEEKEVESNEVFVEWPKSNALKTILCVGDSITVGVGAGANGFSYPKSLQNILGSEYRVINLGIGGYCATEGTDHCYADTDLYKQGLAMDVDTVLLMLGTNDCATNRWNDGTVTAEKYKESLLEMVRTYEAMPSRPEVILMNITLIAQGNENDSHTTEHQRAILKAIDEVAQET